MVDQYFLCNGYKGEIRDNLYNPDSFICEADNKLNKKSLIPALMKTYRSQIVFSDFKAVPTNDIPIKIQTPHNS